MGFETDVSYGRWQAGKWCQMHTNSSVNRKVTGHVVHMLLHREIIERYIKGIMCEYV